MKIYSKTNYFLYLFLKSLCKSEGNMKFEMEDNNYFLKGYDGNAQHLSVPAFADSFPVTKIGAKAFLSCKSITHLTLPETVQEIGDWGFAHMKNLKVLTLPAHSLILGKHVFLDCINLTEIKIEPDCSMNPGLPYFLASAVTVLNSPSLCCPERAGDALRHGEWMEDYDNILIQFLSASDQTGFEPVFLGWFSVEDLDSQTQKFVKQRQQEKTALVFQRLLYPAFLKDSTRKVLYDYLSSHMPEGSLAHEHTVPFFMLCNEFRDDIRYLKIMADTGYITSQTLPILQEGLQDAAPEVIGFLLRYQHELLDTPNFFDNLTL